MSEAPVAAAIETPAPNGVAATQEKVVDETPGFKVFAGNLAYSTTDEGLKAFFAPVEADLITAQVILRGTRSAGYGFVALKSEAAVTKAVELLDKQELDGRPVIVAPAKSEAEKEKKPKAAKKRSNRRGDKAVPGEVTEAEANGETAPSDKPAEGAVALITDEASKPKKKKKSSRKNKKKAAEGEAAAAVGGAGVAAPEATDSAAPAGETEKKSKIARVKRALKPRRPAGEDPAGEPSKSMLFVANLGFNIDEAGLEALFKEAGINVASTRIVRRRWAPRKSKGYGFVDVGDEAEQQKAIAALNDKEVGGRKIAVKVAVNSQVDEANEGAAEATDAAAPAEAGSAPAATPANPAAATIVAA